MRERDDAKPDQRLRQHAEDEQREAVHRENHAVVGAPEQLFFSLYFIMTGIHAAHMVVGIALMLVILGLALRKRFSPQYYGPVEVSGLYWHFVDIVWIFLFPLLYLLGAHLGAAH